MSTVPVDADQELKVIEREANGLIRDCNPWATREDKKLIRHAFEFSQEAHSGVRRKSGEPYILHPLAVARIVVREIGLQDRISVIAALIHDVVEDTTYTIHDIRREFGETVAQIVDGLTKISSVLDPHSSKQAESFRKMLLTMSNDVRVALLKIADRLHNMRTLEHMKSSTQLKIASETMYLYAPLAHRLGLFNIKSELEDLCLFYTQPDVYNDIAAKLEKSKTARDRYIQNFIRPLKEKMSQNDLKCTIAGRVKSVHSIHNKMLRQNVGFDEIYDIFAVRIVLDTPVDSFEDQEECWKAYTIITSLYRRHPDRLRDWITVRKSNGYEALHTTVLGPSGKWVEVQIRSSRMDSAAEKGVAAHWKYKEGGVQTDERFESWLANIRELIENKALSGMDFVTQVKANLVSEQMYVFTPKGELKILPSDATALDFAYEIHTNIGNRCIGAKVNSQVVPLSHTLRNGDQVEIITSEKQRPQESWLPFVKTHKALIRIKDALKMQKDELVKKGKSIFDWKVKQYSIHEQHVFVAELITELKLKDVEDLYYRLGAHKIDVQKLQTFIVKKQQLMNELKSITAGGHTEEEGNRFDEMIQRSRGVDPDSLLIQTDTKHLTYNMAPCCNPIMGDDIVGFLNDPKHILIHRTNCANAIELMTYDGSKIVKAKWSDYNDVQFLSGVQMIGQDRMGILNEIVRAISLHNKIYIRSITIDTNDGMFDGVIKLYVRDTSELDRLARSLLEIEGVFKVRRLTH